MLLIHGEGREFLMRPGEWRSRPGEDVAVGRHQPPSSTRVNDFMDYFQTRYRFDRMGKASRIMAMATAYHRLNYIHPFPDGNGRVSRLMSHAMAHAAGIGAHGLPSTPLPVPGIGRSRWRLELIRCRGGESAIFEVEACDATGHLALPSNLVHGSGAKEFRHRRDAG